VEKLCREGQATDDSMVQWLHKHASVLRYMYIACHINVGKRENSHGAMCGD